MASICLPTASQQYQQPSSVNQMRRTEQYGLNSHSSYDPQRKLILELKKYVRVSLRKFPLDMALLWLYALFVTYMLESYCNYIGLLLRVHPNTGISIGIRANTSNF